MKTITNFTASYPIAALFTTFFALIFLLGLCVFAGVAAYTAGYLFPVLYFKIMLWSVLGISLWRAFFEIKKSKWVYGLLLLLSCNMLISFSNQVLYQAPQPLAIVYKVKPAKKSFSQKLKDLKRKKRKWIRQQIQSKLLPIVSNMQDTEKKGITFGAVLSIIFTILLGILAFTLVLGLSFTIGFNGNGLLAFLLFLFGEGLVIFGLISVLRSIIKKLKRGDASKPIVIDPKDPDKHLYEQ